jgi:hypothetical protein
VDQMDDAAVDRALEAYFADVRRIFKAEVAQVRAATGSKSAAEANSKFEGFQGSFATLEEFHAGAEATLQLGYPNPDTMKGILLEHTAHPSIARLFVTPNYRVGTCLLLEYWWAVDPFAPTKAVLDLLRRLAAARGAEDDDAQEGAGSGTARLADGSGTARLADEVELSLVRGASADVDIEGQTVTFRCRPPYYVSNN